MRLSLLIATVCFPVVVNAAPARFFEQVRREVLGAQPHMVADVVRRSSAVPEYLKSGADRLRNLRDAAIGKGPLADRVGAGRSKKLEVEGAKKLIELARQHYQTFSRGDQGEFQRMYRTSGSMYNKLVQLREIADGHTVADVRSLSSQLLNL